MTSTYRVPLIALVIVVVDQVTKVWAEFALTLGQPVPVVGELLQLRLVYNPGAAFSLGTGYTWIFTVFAIAISSVIVWKMHLVTNALWKLSAGLILGGALGNLVDRLTNEPGFAVGHVVDFLELPRWPVFNVADMGVFFGAVTAMWLAYRNIPYGNEMEVES